jgi:hypothetical protein
MPGRIEWEANHNAPSFSRVVVTEALESVRTELYKAAIDGAGEDIEVRILEDGNVSLLIRLVDSSRNSAEAREATRKTSIETRRRRF